MTCPLCWRTDCAWLVGNTCDGLRKAELERAAPLAPTAPAPPSGPAKAEAVDREAVRKRDDALRFAGEWRHCVGQLQPTPVDLLKLGNLAREYIATDKLGEEIAAKLRQVESAYEIEREAVAALRRELQIAKADALGLRGGAMDQMRYTKEIVERAEAAERSRDIYEREKYEQAALRIDAERREGELREALDKYKTEMTALARWCCGEGSALEDIIQCECPGCAAGIPVNDKGRHDYFSPGMHAEYGPCKALGPTP